MCVRCGDVTHVVRAPLWKPPVVVRPSVPPTPRRAPVIVRSWEVRPVAVPVVAPARWRCDYCGLEDDGPVPERCWLCESPRQAGVRK